MPINPLSFASTHSPKLSEFPRQGAKLALFGVASYFLYRGIKATAEPKALQERKVIPCPGTTFGLSQYFLVHMFLEGEADAFHKTKLVRLSRLGSSPHIREGDLRAFLDLKALQGTTENPVKDIHIILRMKAHFSHRRIQDLKVQSMVFYKKNDLELALPRFISLSHERDIGALMELSVPDALQKRMYIALFFRKGIMHLYSPKTASSSQVASVNQVLKLINHFEACTSLKPGDALIHFQSLH